MDLIVIFLDSSTKKFYPKYHEYVDNYVDAARVRSYQRPTHVSAKAQRRAQNKRRARRMRRKFNTRQTDPDDLSEEEVATILGLDLATTDTTLRSTKGSSYDLRDVPKAPKTSISPWHNPSF